MKTHIKHYPSPPKHWRFNKEGAILLGMYAASSLVMVSIIAFGIYSYLTK